MLQSPMMDDIERAVSLLRAGEVVGLPTETVYGLAADATNPAAVQKIFSIKGRPPGHPLILHIAHQSWLSRYCRDVPRSAFLLAEAFWPGPLSLVLRRNPKSVPDEVTGGLDTVAVRLPAHPVAREVMARLDRPVAAPSANRFGAVSPTTKAHVEADLGSEIALVLEGGPCAIGLESTIVDLTRKEPRLLRPGRVGRAQLEEALSCTVFSDDGQSDAAPGTLASHYAPAAMVKLCSDQEDLWSLAERELSTGKRVGVLGTRSAPSPGRSPELVVEDLSRSDELLAHELYAALRRLDEAGCEVIVSEIPLPHGLGEAAADRLQRAAGPR